MRIIEDPFKHELTFAFYFDNDILKMSKRCFFLTAYFSIEKYFLLVFKTFRNSFPIETLGGSLLRIPFFFFSFPLISIKIFSSHVINLLLTKLSWNRTGGISALGGVFCTVFAAFGTYRHLGRILGSLSNDDGDPEDNA